VDWPRFCSRPGEGLEASHSKRTAFVSQEGGFLAALNGCDFREGGGMVAVPASVNSILSSIVSGVYLNRLYSKGSRHITMCCIYQNSESAGNPRV